MKNIFKKTISSTIYLILSIFIINLFITEVIMAQDNYEKATFAGGCFWCMEPPFEKLKGVKKVISGYTGGQKVNPTYEEVSAGKTGHYESIQITFDPSQITYEELLDTFWKNIDPTDAYGQFADKGTQYNSVIFYHNVKQKEIAEKSKQKLHDSKKIEKDIVTSILPASAFYPAEEYHQDYYKKNTENYNRYKIGSGRADFLKKTWSDEGKNPQKYMRPSKDELKKKLSSLEYKVTQEKGTEPPFKNEYWDNKEPGIYVDIVSGEPLFSSKDKFDSGTGWPSFTKPLEPENIMEKNDFSFFSRRTEVRSKNGGSHLGHVFNDGPKPTGLRYCLNSAALKFIPYKDLEKEGYGEYKKMFE